ncbi:hypothetical protein DDE82_006356 [Stemphylium lycopersici]|nr:hypothetical protein TW65_06374 [Stemphylium lycopersici]RAR01607.1 hypothetical protein DDE82_006356 [Stemphylium lycopersici]
MSSSDIPNGNVTDNTYQSRTGQSEIPVQKDEAPVESTEYDNGGDSDKQLERDEKDAIDSSNIIDERTRGATKQSGTYAEPGDEEGLGAAADGSDERIARQKATQQRVFISGLKGTHTLEKGVAYHYRGHFIYAYPAGNPIEPVPFSTKKGINIVGIAKDRAPGYDPKDPGLVYESSVRALDKSFAREWKGQREEEERRKVETKKMLEDEEEEDKGEKNQSTGLESKSNVEPAKSIKSVHSIGSVADSTAPKTDTQHPMSSHPPSRIQSFTTLLVPPQVASRFPSCSTSRVSLDQAFAPRHATLASNSTYVPRIGTVEAPSGSYRTPGTDSNDRWTPHDRGQYLAYSAPGSRKGSVDNTPWHSRFGSPNASFRVAGPEHGQIHGLGEQDPAIRPVASTSRLAQLLADEGIRSSFTLDPSVALSSSSHVHSSTSTSTGTGSSNTWKDDENMIANLSFAQEWIDPSDISAFVETVSRRPSRAPSRTVSRTHSPSPSPLAGTPEEEMEGGLYLPGLGHPDHRRKTTSMRPQTRASSPSHVSAEGEVHLAILREQNQGKGGSVLLSTTAPGERLPLAMQDHGYAQIAVQPDRLSQSRPPTALQYPPRRASEQINSSTLPLPHQSADASTLYISVSRTGRPRAASRALNQAYNAANAATTHAGDSMAMSGYSTTLPFASAAALPGDFHSATATATEASTAESAKDSSFTPRCPLHDDSCDGSFVAEEHLTLREWSRSGLEAQRLPTIEGVGARVMIDWAALRDEEMERTRGERGERD